MHAVKGEGNGIKFFEEGSGAHQRFPDFYSLENGGHCYILQNII